MSQEPYKNDNKSKFPRIPGRNSGGGEGDSPRKGPRFSIYWVYAIIFAVLIAKPTSTTSSRWWPPETWRNT
jgi:cell division protease FtsH